MPKASSTPDRLTIAQDYALSRIGEPTTVWWSILPTVIGELGLVATSRGLLTILLPGESAPLADRIARLMGDFTMHSDDGQLQEPRRQLLEYFAGRRHTFDLTLDQRGTTFQCAVWSHVGAVAFGDTTTYGEIAAKLGHPGAARAVGAANGANLIPIVIPCHRVVGGQGRLIGYAGGLSCKRALLALEGVVPALDENWSAWAARRLAADPNMRMGPRGTRIFCRLDCRYAPSIKTIPRLFADIDAARQAGFRACRVCRPEQNQ